MDFDPPLEIAMPPCNRLPLAAALLTLALPAGAACPRLEDGDRYGRLNEILDCIEARIDAGARAAPPATAGAPAATGSVVENPYVRASAKARRDAEGGIALTLELQNVTQGDLLLAVESRSAVISDETGATDIADDLKGIQALGVGGKRTDFYTLLSPGGRKNIGVEFAARFGGREVTGDRLAFSIVMLTLDERTKRAKQFFSLGFDDIAMSD